MPATVSQMWSTGPVVAFCATPLNPTTGEPIKPIKVVCLGTGETAPQILEVKRYVPVRTDRSCRGARAKIYVGSEARVTVKLTMWNEAAFEFLERGPSKSRARGTEGTGDLGAVCGIAPNLQPLWLLFPFTTSKAGVYGGGVAGYRFPCALLDGPLARQPGTGPNSLVVQWEAQQVKDGNGNLVLFDHNMSDTNGVQWP